MRHPLKESTDSWWRITEGIIEKIDEIRIMQHSEERVFASDDPVCLSQVLFTHIYPYLFKFSTKAHRRAEMMDECS
jgi:hypothetical protein